MVDEETQDTITESRLYAQKVRAGFTPLVVTEERVVLARDDDGSCVFLNKNYRCELHAELGPARKPLVCRTYPFLLTDTPRGVFAAVSFACPAILSNDGASVENERVGLEMLLRQAPGQAAPSCDMDERVEVLDGLFVTWAEYERLEGSVLAAFDPEHPTDSLLNIALAITFWERQGDRLIVPLSSGQAGSSTSQPVDSLGSLVRDLTCMVSSNLIAMLEEIESVEERSRVGSRLWNQDVYFSNRFQRAFPSFSIRSSPSQSVTNLLERYFNNLIFGKRLLAGGTVVSRLLGTACGLAMLFFYMEAFSDDDSDSEPSSEVIDRAFTLVESELLSHTHSFDGFFREFERALESLRKSL